MDQLEVKRDGLGTLLSFTGRLDTVAAQTLRSPIRAEVERNPASLTCNFRDVNYIGSAVLRLIFEAARELHRRNAQLRILDCPPEIRRVFALTGMDHLVEGGPGPNFSHEINNGALRIFLNGRMDAVRIGEIRDAVRKLVQAHRGAVRFDASAVPYAASAFLHLCIDASKAAKANGGEFGLEKVHPEVAQVFRIAGLQGLLLSSQ
ncbi:MAG: STAS domain-containing protein [Verrucomicrobia bacterium]|nr:STAS domain-containing protein [Verrucomicrobiota bacterium]